MATNTAYKVPELTFVVDTAPENIVVHCSGRITSATVDLLRSTVRPLLTPETKSLVLDLSNVNYLDSSGLGAIIGLYVTGKSAHCTFTLINLNARLKELLSLTRLGEVLTKERDPNRAGVYYSGL
jgi:anti-sigma B factor antagonist